VATREQLAAWVEYASRSKALILFDAAYERFITDASIPHSIFEIPGAREVAVEFRSFSKTAGFTGTRCAYTVVPKAVRAWDRENREYQIWDFWHRRQATKFNGVSYPVQRAAAAVFSEQGSTEVADLIDYYLENARLVRNTMDQLGLVSSGGVNSPYIWVETGGDSWEFFDKLLTGAGVVTTPGAGFGRCGEGFIRISAFNDRERVKEAMDRIGSYLGAR
jgi:LL-diaminopimelate aminotransferase